MPQILSEFGFSAWPNQWPDQWSDPWLGLFVLLIASAIANADFHRRFQASIRSAPRLDRFELPTGPSALDPELNRPTHPLPSLSVIIPAYNEAVNIADCLEAVLMNDWPDAVRLQVIVADDESTDETSQLAIAIAEKDDRVLAFTVPPRPTDKQWLGKNWACDQAAQKATGEYLLFLDADVRLREWALSRAIANAEHYQTDLLSCAPQIISGCFSEQLVQPLMALLIAVGFSFEGINDPNLPNKSAAAGPFMLFRSDAYRQIGGHAAVASNPVEDFALAHEIKSRGLKLRYVLGLDIASVRMYRSFRDLWEGWTKNFHCAGGSNLALTVAAAGAIALVFVMPWLGLVVSALGLWLRAPAAGLTLLVAGIAIALQIYMRLSARDVVSQPLQYLWLGWLGGGLISAIALISAIKTETGWGWTWRGRSLAKNL